MPQPVMPPTHTRREPPGPSSAPSRPLRALRQSCLRGPATLLLLASLLLQTVHAVAPGWWETQQVLTPGTPADDYTVANLGQLKNVAKKAAAELNTTLPGGAGTEINTLISTWSAAPAEGTTRDDYAIATLGQLKSVARPFYDRLGLQYPWALSPWSMYLTSDDFRAATLGQLKNVFSFAVPSTASLSVIDSDGDGFSDVMEYDQFTNPYSATSKPAGVGDVGDGSSGSGASSIPLRLSVLKGDGQTLAAGSSLDLTVMATRNGMPWSDVTVTFQTSSGAGSSITVTTDSNGRASATYVVPFGASGQQVITASAESASASFTLTITQQIALMEQERALLWNIWWTDTWPDSPEVAYGELWGYDGDSEYYYDSYESGEPRYEDWISGSDALGYGNLTSADSSAWSPAADGKPRAGSKSSTYDFEDPITGEHQTGGEADFTYKAVALITEQNVTEPVSRTFMRIREKIPLLENGAPDYTQATSTMQSVETLTITSGRVSNIVYLEPPVMNGFDVSEYLLPVEINSRDRAVEGFIPYFGLDGEMTVEFSCGGKSYGSYLLPASGSSESVYVYNSEEDVFSDEEALKWKNNELPQISTLQEVTFIREGNGFRFSTVSDSLGEFTISLQSGTTAFGSVSHTLSEDKDFARLIAAVHGMVNGASPPKIKAWDDDPNPFADDRTIFAAPPPDLPPESLASVLAAAPAVVAADFPDSSILLTQEGFNQFTNLVRENVSDEDWNTFCQTLLTLGVAQSLPVSPDDAVGAAEGGGSWWSTWWNEKPEPRNEMQLPEGLSNRGLVAKCLIYWVKKLIKAHVATGEGVVFGLWDGLSSDVDGVCAVLKTPVDLYNKLRDPWGAASEIYHSFKVIKELGWEGVKQKAIDMFNFFMQEQEDRLDMVLGDQCKDPIYFGAYMGGYLTGYVGEQIAGALLTAGAIKAGWIGKAIREGSALLKTVTRLTDPLHHFSKAFAKVRGRYTRTTGELRAMRTVAQKCGPDGYCLVTGTLVLMADHSFKQIDDIMPGDWVWSDDPADDKPAGPAQVQFQSASFTINAIQISWDCDGDGRADGSLSASAVHPFHVRDLGWVEAEHLRPGQQMVDDRGRSTTITSVGIVPGYAATYDIGLDQVHGFFAGASPESLTLTHNANWDVTPYSVQADLIPGGGIDPSTQKPARYKKHHFFYDAWLAVHYEGLYRKGRKDGSFPTIQVEPDKHDAMHKFSDQYFRSRFGVAESKMTAMHWSQISPEEMHKLALNMGKAGGIPDSKMNELMNKQNQWFFKKLDQVFGCLTKK